MEQMQNMIPKVIHYCWFGKKELPALARKCIKSWKIYCPEYEIIQWNEENFNVQQTSYTNQAYQTGKFAFVSDYARFFILEKYGGIYMDTDVELIRPLDDILCHGSYMGCEEDGYGDSEISLNPGLGMACRAHNVILNELLNQYNTLSFINPDGTLNQTTIVHYTTQVFKQFGLNNITGIQRIGEFYIYPREYFSPQHYKTGHLTITENTHSIHHYSASWYSPYEHIADKLSRKLGPKRTQQLIALKKWLKRRS